MMNKPSYAMIIYLHSLFRTGKGNPHIRLGGKIVYLIRPCLRYDSRNGPVIQDMAAQLGWADASSLADANGLVALVNAWLVAGTPNSPATFPYTDSNLVAVTRDFDTHILPLFTRPDVWYPGTEACNAAGCHNGVGGSHDLDMGTYAGILLGADAGAEPIIDPVNPLESPLRKRLRNNRMPWGMPTWVPRDGPNGEVAQIVSWIAAGALDN